MLKKTACLLAICCIPALASAQQVATLKDAAQRAILNNPDVLVRWHSLEAARGERDAAFGSLLPRLDVSAGGGRDRFEDPTSQNLNRRTAAVTLSQLIYDGFATSNEVKRLDHVTLIRMFELLDASETVTLDVVRVYVDVLRFRALLSMAEDNYIRHRSVFEQIQRKAQAGVGRRVDLEQASGRLALSESNLLTEIANLHDVSARFQRLVGVAPPKELQAAALLKQEIPANRLSALRKAIERNPALLASIENVRSADRAARIRNAAFQPRFDVRLRSEDGRNVGGIAGDTRSDSAEIVMSWNLFSGFSDRARVRQFAEQLNVARDQRDKACRDIRQNLLISYNDTEKLTEQLIYFDQHQIAIEKARDAYRKQFDIGQRTLLDVLDTETELFQARRAYINAEHDYIFAYARVHATQGTLFSVLGLSRPDIGSTPELKRGDGADALDSCPVESPEVYVADKPGLNQRAMEIVRESAAAQQAAVQTLAAQGITPPVELNGTPPVTPAPAAPVEPSVGQAVLGALNTWAAAWRKLDIAAYLDSYSSEFKPANGSSRGAWATQRRDVLARAQQVELNLSNVRVESSDSGRAVTRFTQSYRSPGYQDVVEKTLEWEKRDGRWLILSETAGSSSAPVRSAAPATRTTRTIPVPAPRVTPSSSATAATPPASATPSSSTSTSTAAPATLIAPATPAPPVHTPPPPPASPIPPKR